MISTMKHGIYTGSLEVSAEDGVLHGKILYIRDMISYEADTVPLLKKAFEECVDEYLEDCKDIGKAPNEPYSGVLNIDIGKDIHRSLGIQAINQNRSIEYVVSQLLTAGLLMNISPDESAKKE